MSDQQNSKSCSLDPGYWAMVGGVFKGRTGWLSVIVMVYALVFFAVAIVSAVKFFDTPEAALKDQIMWATIFLSSTLLMMVCKIWFWTTMNKNTIVDGLKCIASQLGSDSEQSGE